MAHVRLKPTREIKIEFHPSELDEIIIPKESKKIAKDYLTSKNLAENQNYDIMIMLEDKAIFGYDYLHNDKKLILPEVNPVTIFYSNAVMSHAMIQHYKEKLLSDSSEAGKTGEIINLTHSGTFFQLATNCIVNLQATLESFANRVIPEDFLFIDKTGKKILPTVSHKLYSTIPKIKNMNFRLRKNKKYNVCIENLFN